MELLLENRWKYKPRQIRTNASQNVLFSRSDAHYFQRIRHHRANSPLEILHCEIVYVVTAENFLLEIEK